MSTNVNKVADFNKINSFKFSQAKGILDQLSAPKPTITIIHAVLYPDNIRVHYTLDVHQGHAKIMLPKMEKFLLDGYSSREISDINIYSFLDENLNAVCQAYIAAGKELTAL